MANRYQDLLGILPRGDFYSADGEVLPFLDKPHQFEFRTTKTNREFAVYMNDSTLGTVTTDSEGRAIVRGTVTGTKSALPPGEYQLKIVDPIDNETYNYFFTIKHIATWLAAYAEVLNKIDDDIDEMDKSRSLETVTPQYVESIFGRAVRQPKLATYYHNEYKHLLRQLRQAYRHFGAHPYGLSQAIEALTSVSPLVVPRAWKPRWSLGSQICPNNDFQDRTRVAEAMYGPAGAVAGSPIDELPNLNRQSRYYIHPSVSGTVTTGFRAPPIAQRVTVTVPDAQRVTLIGLNEKGVAISEVVPDYGITVAAGTYLSDQLFSSITSVTKAGGAAQIGLGKSRFVGLKHFNSYFNPGSSLTLQYVKRESDNSLLFDLTGGIDPPHVLKSNTNALTLRTDSRPARLIGLTQVTATVGTYNLNPSGSVTEDYRNDRLWIDIDKRGIVGVDFNTSSATATAIANEINFALNTDPRYGFSYVAVASVLTGTEGDGRDALMLTSPTIGPAGSIEVVAGPQDASSIIFGPRGSTRLALDASGTTALCVSTVNMPTVSALDAAPYRRRFKVRIRGRRGAGFSTTATTVSGYSAAFAAIPLGVALTPNDVGSHVAHTDYLSVNDGVHRIVGVVAPATAIVIHEKAHTGVVFNLSGGGGFGTATFYDKGEIATVIDNNTVTNILTFEQSLAKTWTTTAIVELVNETPLKVEGEYGLGMMDIEVDRTLRPFHEYGESISFVSGTTWRLTCSRANFTGLSGGRDITFSGCQNIENNGVFNIVSASGTTCDFTNPSGGIAETSSFEWWVDDIEDQNIDDAISVQGALMPDGWQMTSAGTVIRLHTGTTKYPSTGRIVPSRVVLTSTGSIQIQRDVPEALAWRGMPLDVAFWLHEHTEIGAGAVYSLDVSFKSGVFYPVASLAAFYTSILNSTFLAGPLIPFKLSSTFFVPYDAEQCVLRLTRSAGTGTSTMSLEQMTLISSTGTGLYCGRNTIPRTQKRAKFGEMVYVWSAENLNEEENQSLGMPIAGTEVPGTSIGVTIPAKPGHIDYITNAQGYYGRVDVSEVDESGATPVRKNIRGMYDSTDWAQVESYNLLTRMGTVVGTPSRMSYVRPETITSVTREDLLMFDGGDGPGTARSTLSQDTNHDGPAYPQAPNTGLGTGARLYEVKAVDSTLTTPEGLITVIPAGTPIPLPDTLDEDGVQPWEFMSATQIRVNAPYYEGTSSYVLDYDVVMRATTPPIQLSAGGADTSEYVWMVDFARYVRHQVDDVARPRVQQVVFGTDYTARLTNRAVDDGLATLERDDGTKTEIIPFTLWSFQDSKTVRLEASEFNANAIYTLTYTAKTIRVGAGVTFRLEWRSAASEISLASATWEEVYNGKIVSPFLDPMTPDVTVNVPRPWHQLRVTVSGVEDVRDFRIYGLGIRGVHLYGTEAYAPGVITAS